MLGLFLLISLSTVSIEGFPACVVVGSTTVSPCNLKTQSLALPVASVRGDILYTEKAIPGDMPVRAFVKESQMLRSFLLGNWPNHVFVVTKKPLKAPATGRLSLMAMKWHRRLVYRSNQEDDPKKIRKLLERSALAPPVGSIHFKVRPDMSARVFLEEYKELKRILFEAYPHNEFLVISPHMHVVPHGYEVIPFMWRGCSLYMRRAA